MADEPKTLFDLDEVMADAPEPVRVRYQGTEYVLGGDALGVVTAEEVWTDLGENPAPAKLVETLPRVLRCLCPDFPEDAKLTVNAALVLLEAATEAIRTAHGFPSSAEE